MPQTPQNDNSTSRIPLKPSTHDEIREFRNGLKAESYDEAILLLLYLVKGDEDTYLAGKNLREKLEDFRKRE